MMIQYYWPDWPDWPWDFGIFWGLLFEPLRFHRVKYPRQGFSEVWFRARTGTGEVEEAWRLLPLWPQLNSVRHALYNCTRGRDEVWLKSYSGGCTKRQIDQLTECSLHLGTVVTQRFQPFLAVSHLQFGSTTGRSHTRATLRCCLVQFAWRMFLQKVRVAQCGSLKLSEKKYMDAYESVGWQTIGRFTMN